MSKDNSIPAKKHPKTITKHKPGVKLDLAASAMGAIAEADKKAKAGPILARINLLKERARKESVAFPPELEKSLMACKTMGDLKRTWKAHRQLV